MDGRQPIPRFGVVQSFPVRDEVREPLTRLGYPDEVHQGVVVIRDARRIASVGFAFEDERWGQLGGSFAAVPALLPRTPSA